MRLDKLLSETGYGSRRQVKKLIKGKQVRIDGELILTDNYNADSQLQEILVAGKKVTHNTHVYYMLNKPNGVVSAVRDEENPTVLDLLAHEDIRAGLFPVGRLDKDTEGLLLITDNGQLAHQLLVPHKEIFKTYEVKVNGLATTEDQETFAKGIIFHGGIQCKPAKLTILAQSPSESHVLLSISEGKFHQVKKMFLSVGKKVTYLKRLTMGPLTLDEDLAVGTYRPLNQIELDLLKPYFK